MPAAGRGESNEGPPALAVRALRKSFGPTQALRSGSLDLQPGEVHAIVGENGSGKSTLVKILSGVHRPDGGEILLGGEPLRRLRSPRDAQTAGICTVFQEVLVVGARSVLENVWMGTDGLLRTRSTIAQKRTSAQAALADLLDAPPRLDAPVDSLSLSERQACCIARALVRRPRILILDESTSALDVATRRRLFATLGRLCADGSSVVFISHRMDEVAELADRVTVLRAGESVVTLNRADAATEVLVRHMTGSEHLTDTGSATPARAGTRGEVRLRTQDLRLTPQAASIDFTLHAGELVGLAGLEGHGQDAFLRALQGEGGIGGQVICDGRSIASARSALDAGIVYVPRDRRGEAIFPTLSIAENFSLPTLGRDRRAGLVAPGASRRRLDRYVEKLGIRLANPRQPITALSGGNQQKVVVARWLDADPRVLLLNDPTRGVDLGAKRDLYRVLEELAADGMAIVMLSTEVDEHVELMDRVLVFREHAVSAELPRDRLDRTTLIGAFFVGSEAP